MAIGTVTGIALGVMAYLLGPLGFPLRFAGSWPARSYDAAMALGVLLALCVPATAGRAAARRAGRSLSAGAAARQGAMAGLCSGTAAALAVAVLSTATIARARQPAPAVMALLVAAFVICVLVTAAVHLSYS